MASTPKSKPSKEPPTDIIDVVRDDHHQGKKNPQASMPLKANARRSEAALKSFAASFIVTLAAVALVWYLGEARLEDRLASLSPGSGPPASETAQVGAIEAKFEAMQKQLDAWRRDQLTTQKELREAIERVSAAKPASDAATPVTVPGQPQPQPGGQQVAEAFMNVTPTQAEFIQLKERNRLTAYADEAIIKSDRKALETLVEYIRGSGSDHLRDAAQAEYMRVVRMIHFYQREDPNYRLPVTELFKGEPVQNEADLMPPHLFKLLADTKLPWEVRLRAAVLLRSSDAPETNARLIEAIKTDPILDVAKHAQITLEQRIQRRFRPFDIPAIDEWAAEQAR